MNMYMYVLSKPVVNRVVLPNQKFICKCTHTGIALHAVQEYLQLCTASWPLRSSG